MSQQNVEAIHGMYEAWRQQDWDAFVNAFDPDIEFVELPAFGMKVHRGRDELAKAVQWWPSQWEDFRAELKQVVELSDDRLVLVNRHFARPRESSIELDEEVAYLMAFRDGKAVRVEMFRTLEEALDAAAVQS